MSVNITEGSFRRKTAPSTIASLSISSSVFSEQSEQSSVSDYFSGYNAEASKRTLGILELVDSPRPESPHPGEETEPAFDSDALVMPYFEGDVSGSAIRGLTESETSGGTVLYHAVHQGFKEIISGLSHTAKPDHEIIESINSVLAFKFWIEAQRSRLTVWSDEVGVKDSVLDSLRNHKPLESNKDLREMVTKYLVGIYEALILAGRNIIYGLYNLDSVKEM
jgi:hypothetical protein